MRGVKGTNQAFFIFLAGFFWSLGMLTAGTDGDYELLLKIGDEDSDSTYATFENMAVTADGSVYISNVKKRKVDHFDNQGNFIGNLGKRGSGPGEYRSPGAIAVNDENIYLHDAAMTQMLIFDLSGKWQRTLKPMRVEAFVELRANGRFSAVGLSPQGEKLFLYDADGKNREVLLSIAEPVEVLSDREGASVMAYSDVLATRIKNGYVVVNSETFAFKIYDDNGNVKHKISQPFSRVPYDRVDHPRPDALAIGAPNRPLDEFDFPEYEKDIRRVIAVDDGFLVVTAQKSLTKRLIYRYDLDGKLLGKIEFPNMYGIPHIWSENVVWSVKDNAEEGISVLLKLKKK